MRALANHSACAGLFFLIFSAFIFCTCPGDDDDPAPSGADDDLSDDTTPDGVDDDSGGHWDDDVDDDADDETDDAQDDTESDDTVDDDTEPPVLDLISIDPTRGGASVATHVALNGNGFAAGLAVFVGGAPAQSVLVTSPTTAEADFPPVAATDVGVKDVHVEQGEQSDDLYNAFEYYFDEDPIVFVHGWLGDASDFDTMVGRFIDMGYPEDYLAAIDFSDNTGSNIDNARDELPPFVESVLAMTGAEKVDVVAHSMGGLSSRLWIKMYDGADKVRDYVSLAGTQHGNNEACLVYPFYEAARELCPAYAGEGDAENDIQWILNGEPNEVDVDETPFGREDGGWISYHAMWAELDEVVIPNKSACLNQAQPNDCSDPINVKAPLTFHLQMVTSRSVFDNVTTWVREYNVSKP